MAELPVTMADEELDDGLAAELLPGHETYDGYGGGYEADGVGGAGRGLRPHRGHTGPGPKVFKALCPDLLMSSLIGKKGSERKQIEEATSSRLHFSGRDETYPNTRCRILTVHANETWQILQAVERVVERIVEVAAREDPRATAGKGGRRGGPDDESLTGKEQGEYVFRGCLPQTCAGAFLGTRGAKIQELREKTGAKVFLENENYNEHQMLRIIGPPEAILLVIPQVVQDMDEVLSAEMLARWASLQPFGAPSSHRGGGGGTGGGAGCSGGGKEGREGGREGGRDGGREGGRKGGGKHRGRSPSRSASRGGARSRSRRYHGGHDQPAPTAWSESWNGQWEENDARRAPDLAVPTASAATSGGAEAAIQNISQLVHAFPPGRIDSDHAISCDLPASRIGSLIGRRGEFVTRVKKDTGAQVVFSDLPKGEEDTHRTMTVTGPLVAIYAAHMAMMKKYHEDEIASEREAIPRARMDQIDHLQSQVADLQRQLEEARSGGGIGGGGWPPRRSSKGQGRK